MDPRPITNRPRENDRQRFDAAGTEYIGRVMEDVSVPIVSDDITNYEIKVIVLLLLLLLILPSLLFSIIYGMIKIDRITNRLW